MEENMFKQAMNFLRQQKKRKNWHKLVGILAAIVVFGTTYALILPAITLEKPTYCGKEEHRHSESCFTQKLICEKSEKLIPENTHTEESSENEKTLSCGLEESEEHTHTEECYTDVDTLNGNQEEGKDTVTTVPVHTHTEECYEKVLSCDLEEHTHDAVCYVDDSIEKVTQKVAEATTKKAAEEVTEETTKQTIEESTDENVQEATESKGDMIASFETELLSDFGTISAGDSVTININDTVTLEGSSGNRNNWSVNPEGYVSIQKDGNNAVITGIAAGIVTITHTYTNKGASESFTVIVKDGENSDIEKEAEGSGYTVTVKGNKKVLADDVTLHVEDYNKSESDYEDYYHALIADLESATSSSISEDNFNFLQMYHIYLTKEGQEGEYIPEGNINLQVTITYNTVPDNWGKVNWVGHYKKTNGKVNGMELSDDSSASNGVKQIRVSGNSITFHIQNFSVFPVAALETDSGGGSTTGGGTMAEPDGSILTSEQLSWIGDSSSNEWQIVDQEYAGNEGINKTESSDGKVRVQKNVIPTGVENEFLVYLSIDTKQLFADFFASAAYKATTSNNYHDQDLGTVVTAMTGNQNVDVVGQTTRYTNHANFTILSSSGELLADNITLYWSQANNVTFYLEVNDGDTKKYVLTGVKVEKNGQETIMLSEEAERLIMSNIAQMAHLDEIIDNMGDYVDFVSVVSGDYDTVPVYEESTRILTWVPTIKANPIIDKVRTEESKTVTWTDHEGHVRTETVYKYTSWALNTSELIYKVKLNVEKDGFNSAANNMNSNVGDSESYKVNNSAILSYGGDSTIDFPVPYVRGLLYDVQFDKVDKDNTSKKLSGAVFELENASGKKYTITGNSDGTYRGVNLPYGMYILTEVSPPKGYSKIKDESEPWMINVCYTKDKTNIEQDSFKKSNMLYIGNNNVGNMWQIQNEKRRIYVDLIKTDMSYSALNGAIFSIYDIDPSTDGAKPVEGYENISVNDKGIIVDNMELEDGKIYYIVETKAPDGYNLPSTNVILTVDLENNIDDPISVSGGAGRIQKDSETQEMNGVESTVYVIKIPNNPGVELPATGGTGTLPYIFGGLGLILISILMYGYSMRRKQERRSI